MTENVKWLTTCPVSDQNFKDRLKAASAQEVREALEFIEGLPFAETKEKTLRVALKKKESHGEISGCI